MGMRNPYLCNKYGLIKYAASLDDVHRIAQRVKPVTEQRPVQSTPQSAPVQVLNQRLLFNNHKSMNKNQQVKNKGLKQSEELFEMFIDEN